MLELTDWLRSKNPEFEGAIPRDIDLIENRMIESLMFLELITLLEEISGEPIDVGSLNIDDFRTLDRISERFLKGDA